MRLAAAPGLTVRDPRTHSIIPPEGVEVGEFDFDLLKMLADGDLVEIGPVSEPGPEPAAKGPAAPVVAAPAVAVTKEA